MGNKMVLLGSLLLAIIFTSGCIYYSDKLIVNQDLSGSYFLHYGVSKEMLKDKDKEGSSAVDNKQILELSKSDFERSYPAGTKLVNFEQNEKLGAEFVNVEFSLDNLDKFEKLLSEIDKISKQSSEKSESTPFRNKVSISKSGDTVKVKRSLLMPEDKKDKDKAKDKDSEAMEKMMEQMIFGSIFLTYEVELPKEPVSHNATYREGKTLTWHIPLLILMNQKKVDMEFAF